MTSMQDAEHSGLLVLLAVRTSRVTAPEGFTTGELAAAVAAAVQPGVDGEQIRPFCSNQMDSFEAAGAVHRRESSRLQQLLSAHSDTVWIATRQVTDWTLDQAAGHLGYRGPVPDASLKADIAWCMILLMRMHDEDNQQRIDELLDLALDAPNAGATVPGSISRSRDVLDKLRDHGLAENKGRFTPSWRLDQQLQSLPPLDLRERMHSIWTQGPDAVPDRMVTSGSQPLLAHADTPDTTVEQRKLDLGRAFSWQRVQSAIVEALQERDGLNYFDLADATWLRMERPDEDRLWKERPGDPNDKPLFEFRMSRSANTLRAVDVAESEKGGTYRLTRLGREIKPETAANRCRQYVSLWTSGQQWTGEKWREWSQEQGGYPEWYVKSTTERGEQDRFSTATTPVETFTEQITLEGVKDYLTVLGRSWKSAMGIAKELIARDDSSAKFYDLSPAVQQKARAKVVEHLTRLEQQERAERRKLDEDPASDMWRQGEVSRVIDQADQNDFAWASRWARDVVDVLLEEQSKPDGRARVPARDLNDRVAEKRGLTERARQIPSLMYPTQREYQTRVAAVRAFLAQSQEASPALLERSPAGKTVSWALSDAAQQFDLQELRDQITRRVADHFADFVKANSYKLNGSLEDEMSRAERRATSPVGASPRTEEAVDVSGAVVGDTTNDQVLELRTRLLNTLRDVVSGHGLEYIAALVFDGRGYRHVEVTEPGTMGRTGDGGIDIQMSGEDEDGWTMFWVQVKKSAKGKRVASSDVRGLSGAKGDRPGKAMFVSLAGFTLEARDTAQEGDIELVDGEMFCDWMLDAGVGVRIVGNETAIDLEFLHKFEVDDQKQLAREWRNAWRRDSA